MKSATDAFEDAEIAREEMPHLVIDAAGTVWEERDGTSSGGRPIRVWREVAGIDSDRATPVEPVTQLSRQSPASTTAADAWDACLAAIDAACGGSHTDMIDNPYRVAAPEGDGGNE